MLLLPHKNHYSIVPFVSIYHPKTEFIGIKEAL